MNKITNEIEILYEYDFSNGSSIGRDYATIKTDLNFEAVKSSIKEWVQGWDEYATDGKVTIKEIYCNELTEEEEIYFENKSYYFGKCACCLAQQISQHNNDAAKQELCDDCYDKMNYDQRQEDLNYNGWKKGE